MKSNSRFSTYHDSQIPKGELKNTSHITANGPQGKGTVSNCGKRKEGWKLPLSIWNHTSILIQGLGPHSDNRHPCLLKVHSMPLSFYETSAFVPVFANRKIQRGFLGGEGGGEGEGVHVVCTCALSQLTLYMHQQHVSWVASSLCSTSAYEVL